MKYHFAAAAVALVWGSTLISSKILLVAGMTPMEIMFVRFLLAYVFLWILYPRAHKIKCFGDEFKFFLMGLFGCTLYFICENTALLYTSANNVGLICATVPLFTGLVSRLLLKNQKLTRYFFIGSAISFFGVAIVILNGNFTLKINSFGDFLTILAVISWAFFCVIQKMLKEKYDSLYLTRKIFFYGLISMSLLFVINPFNFPFSGFLQPRVWGNLCFLGLLASGLCYWLWGVSIKHLGAIATNNYVYFVPVVTIIFSSIFLGERLTMFTGAGTVFIIGGLWISGIKSCKKSFALKN